MADCNLAGSPSRIGFSAAIAAGIFRSRIRVSGTLKRQFTSWVEARFISTWKFSILPVK